MIWQIPSELNYNIEIEIKSEVAIYVLSKSSGEGAYRSLADVILGKAYPSGKLKASWLPIMDYPSTRGFGELDDTYYNEGIYVGYRYFDTVNCNPTFHFGFGLGYTQFKIINTNIKADKKYIFIESIVKK